MSMSAWPCIALEAFAWLALALFIDGIRRGETR